MKILLLLLALCLLLDLDVQAQEYNTVQGRKVERATLLSAVTTTSDGAWIGCEGYNTGTVQVSGITTATVTFNISVAPAKPANNTAGVVAGQLTADGAIVFNAPARWCKAAVTAHTTGTITATLEAYQQ